MDTAPNNNTLTKTLFFATSVFFASTVSHTALAENLVGITNKISTLGLGAELNIAIGHKVELTTGMNLLDIGFGEISNNGVKYDGTFFSNSFYAGVRAYPWANGLYFGGGASLNNNSIRLIAKPNKDDEYVFNDEYYQAEYVGKVQTTGSYLNIAPIIFSGFETSKTTEKGISFFGEIGMMLSLPPKFEMDLVCSQVSAPSCDDVKENFKVEQESIQDAFFPAFVLPILGAGIRYRY